MMLLKDFMLAQKAKEKYGLSVVPLKKPKDVLPYVEEVFDLLNKGYEHLFMEWSPLPPGR